MDEQEAVDTLGAVPGGGAEGAVISESQWGAVRAMFAGGKSRKAIARELGLDAKTVRKWLRQPFEPQRRRARGRQAEELSEFLRARALEVGFNGAVLYREAVGRGYKGSYSALARFVAPWRRAFRGQQLATVRFETSPGQQAQVDWGSTWVFLGETRERVHLFVMVLGYSRRIFARGSMSEGLDALLGGHEHAFAHFGGRTATILYDNPRTIVLSKDEASGAVTWNAAFRDRMDFYGVEPRLCRYYRAQTKGKVESGVKYVKRNALAGRRFADLAELNAWLETWCVTVADERIHGTTHERPAERFRREEAKALVAVDKRPPTPRERFVSRIVPRDGYVSVDSNRYPVPLDWAGHRVEVQILAEAVVVCRPEMQPIRHARLSGKHQVGRWSGVPRVVPRSVGAPAEGPPQLDPAYLGEVAEVAVRSMDDYAEVAS